MKKTLAPSLVLVFTLLAFTTVGSAHSLPKPDGSKCKKGYVRKNGKCVKAKAKLTPHPGLNVVTTPGSHVGTRGVTMLSSTSPEGFPQFSLKITFPSGHVSCQGLPPYPSITVTVGTNMAPSDQGYFGGTNEVKGAYASVSGHFTGANTLVLESAGVSNFLSHGERCAAQYTNTSVVF
jgi:hypothetical protein